MLHMCRQWNLVASLLVTSNIFFGSSHVFAQTQPAQALRPEVLRQVRSAQDAFAAKQYERAMSTVNEVLNNQTLTDYERGTSLRVRAAIASMMGNLDLAIDSLEAALVSNSVVGKEKISLLEVLVSLVKKKNDFQRMVKWSRVYIAEGGPQSSMRNLLIQSLASQAEHRQVIDEVQRFMIADSKEQQKTGELELRAMAIAYKNLKDEAGYTATIKKLQTLYPSKVYLKEAVGSIAIQSGFNSRWSLDLYRLLDEADCLDDEESFLEMINHAMKAGLPAEAQRILDKGFAAGLLGKGDRATAHAKLRGDVLNKVREDEKVTALLLKSPQTSNSWISVAEFYFSRQEWDLAHTAFTNAASMGQVRRENEMWLHDGIALIKLGKKEEALQSFEKVQRDESAIEIAWLWRQQKNK